MTIVCLGQESHKVGVTKHSKELVSKDALRQEIISQLLSQT